MYVIVLAFSILSPTISLAQPKEMATFRKLFRRPGEISNANANDNIRECAPTVRRAVVSARKRWGIFHFVCTNGVVRNVFVDIDSMINHEPATFIEKNLALFDLHGSSIAVRFDGDKGSEWYRGSVMANAEIFRVVHDGTVPGTGQGVRPISTRDLQTAPERINGKYAVFELGLVDPEDTNLDSPQKIRDVR